MADPTTPAPARSLLLLSLPAVLVAVALGVSEVVVVGQGMAEEGVLFDPRVVSGAAVYLIGWLGLWRRGGSPAWRRVLVAITGVGAAFFLYGGGWNVYLAASTDAGLVPAVLGVVAAVCGALPLVEAVRRVRAEGVTASA